MSIPVDIVYHVHMTSATTTTTTAALHTEALVLLNSDPSIHDLDAWFRDRYEDIEAAQCNDDSYHGENANDIFEEENGRLPETQLEKSIVDLTATVESLDCDMIHGEDW